MKKRWTVLILAVLILLCGIWHLLFGGIKDRITLEAGTAVELSDLSEHGGFFLEAVTGLEEIDLSVPGEYPVILRCLWRQFESLVVVEDTTPPTGNTRDLTCFYTQPPDEDDFLISSEDATALTVSYAQPPDVTQKGTQTVTIRLTDLGGNVTDLEASLTLIFDDTPPTISGAADQKVYLGTVLELLDGVTIIDDLDQDAVLTLDDGGLNWNAAGIYPVTYRAVDACGNEAQVTVHITVIHDDTPPQILGVSELSIYLGSTVAYRKGIIVTDDTDAAPTLSVDASAVDLSQPGTYPVTYIAADCVGNTAVKETTITVREAPSVYVAETVILEAADKLLEKIVIEGMTTREQVEAIYDYIDARFYYVNTSDKSDWMQSAYKMIQTQRGDCFSFYALSRLLFERLGIPNLTVTRLKNTHRTSSHYWNMVSLDGGESWYHYDSTPHMVSPMETCLVTDADLERFNQSAPYYYHWDREAYPTTPEN